MKIELKHYSPYVLTGVKYQNREGIIATFDPEDLYDLMCNIRDYENYDLSNYYKLILHPLSNLKKEIEHNGRAFVPQDELEELLQINGLHFLNGYTIYSGNNVVISIEEMQTVANKLYEWHFDVYELIDKGLAIDINLLNQK